MHLISENSNKNISPIWQKWLKIIGIIILSLFLLMIIGYFILSAYINSHKKELLTSITEKISENIDGELRIEDMKPAILKSFPDISVELTNITLRDSLYQVHKKNTIKLQSVFVKINLFSFFTPHPDIKKVTISNGEVYLFKQKDEYSNAYLFQKKDKKKKKKKKKGGLEFDNFSIENVVFTYDNFLRNKQFKMEMYHVEGFLKIKGSNWYIRANTNALVHQLGFNLDKGGYLDHKTFEGQLKLIYHKNNGHLDIPKQTILVDKVPLDLKAMFNLQAKPVLFELNFNLKSINYTQGINMLTRHLTQKLKIIEMEKNISAEAFIKGSFAFPDTPLVNIYFNVKDNVIKTPYGTVKKANLKPEFNNHVYPDKGRSDNNTAISIPKFTGTWYGIPLNGQKIRLFDLTNPILDAHFKSEFPINHLNELVGESFNLKKGNASMDITYHGPLTIDDQRDYEANGYVKVSNADFSYLPRNLNFKNCGADFHFAKKDLFLENVHLNTKNSKINIKGDVKNFLSSFLNDPSKAIFNWDLESQSIDLNDFKTLLGARQSKVQVSQATKNRKIRALDQKVDDLLAKSTFLLNLNVRNTNYRRFKAKNIIGNIALGEASLDLNKVRFNHAGGSIAADGKVLQNQKGNPFEIKAKVQGVQVNQLFYAFEDFGQNSIVDTNIKGSFSADVQLKGLLGETLNLVPNSFDGRINFKLNNGELINFPPFITISKFIFKNRNLDSITFENLSNNLSIRNGKVNIPSMEIESSAIRMVVEGVFAFQKGTDISIKIPLRNPEKDRRREERGLEPKKDKGIILYLRAKDDDKGKVHITWDPLKKGVNENSGNLFDSTYQKDTFFIK